MSTWGWIHLCEGMFPLSSDKHPEVELPDHVVVPFFNFLRRLRALSHSGCISFPFPHILTNTSYLLSL